MVLADVLIAARDDGAICAEAVVNMLVSNLFAAYETTAAAGRPARRGSPSGARPGGPGHRRPTADRRGRTPTPGHRGGGAGDAAALPTPVVDRARGHRADRVGRISFASWPEGLAEPVRHASGPALLPPTTRVRAGPLARPVRDRRAAQVRLHAVRRRSAAVPRRGLRQGRDGHRRSDGAAALPPAPGRRDNHDAEHPHHPPAPSSSPTDSPCASTEDGSANTDPADPAGGRGRGPRQRSRDSRPPARTACPRAPLPLSGTRGNHSTPANTPPHSARFRTTTTPARASIRTGVTHRQAAVRSPPATGTELPKSAGHAGRPPLPSGR